MHAEEVVGLQGNESLQRIIGGRAARLLDADEVLLHWLHVDLPHTRAASEWRAPQPEARTKRRRKSLIFGSSSFKN